VKVPFFISDEALILTIGGQIVSDGAVYAQGFADTRGPGGYFFGAILTYIFGYGNTIAYHLCGIIIQLIILILIRQLGRKLFEEDAANASCLFFAIFSYAYHFHDTMAFNVEFMAIPFLLGSAILFYGDWLTPGGKSIASPSPFRLLISGLFCAIIFAIKQVMAGCLAIYVFIVFLGWIKRNFCWQAVIKATIWLSLGFVIGSVCLFGPSLVSAGWRHTLYWLALFSMKHYNPGTLAKILSFTQRVILMFIANPLLWIFTILWMVTFIRSYHHLDDKHQRAKLFLFLMVFMQWLGATIGGQVGGHNLMPAIAFMSLMVGDIFNRSLEWIKHSNISSTPVAYKTFVVGIIFIGLVPPIIHYTMFPEGVQTKDYSVIAFYHEKLRENQDPLSKTVSFIRENTAKGDRIFVMGRLYEVYPLSQRLPATIALGLSWFEGRDHDTYLTEIYQGILQTLEDHPPKVMVLPCPDYGGINLENDSWKGIRTLLEKKYEKAQRLSWQSRLKFFRGKQKMMENIEEWVDVYLLTPSKNER
jgi:hypothetical protein